METAGLMLLLWLVHAVLGAAVSAPILFIGRRQIGWSPWLPLALVIPFGAWALLALLPLAVPKGLSNLVEPLWLTAAMPVLATVRVVFGKRIPEKVQAAVFLTMLSLAAAALFFFVPALPE